MKRSSWLTAMVGVLVIVGAAIWGGAQALGR